MKKVLRIVALIILVALAAFAAVKLFFPAKESGKADVIEQAGEKSDEKASALPVRVVPAERGRLPLRLRVSAVADVWEKAVMKAEISSTVESLSLRIGSRVQAGQVLVKLDDREPRLEMERAETAKLKALSEFLVNEDVEIELPEIAAAEKQQLQELRERYLKAAADFEAGRISENAFQKISEEYDTRMVFSGALREDIRRAKDGLSDAMIQLKKARLDLKRTTIRAPFSGIVADIQISLGEKVSAGRELVKVVNLDSLYLKGYALESEIRHLRKGTGARILMDSYPDEIFRGEIESISPEVDSDKKTLTVYVKVDNQDHRILPGMHAEMDIEYKVFENVIKVPRKAVLIRQNPLVFVVQDQTAIWKYVELGENNDEEIHIKSGLNEGELVVVEGQMTLAHQSRVKIIE
ncbi:MAG: efflux RND transporter periplasmic adaptor subunit [Acidobacteriota bacterium]|jgi:HlyD family secretion protein|nr:efflux RND transporter periplasmic adaptor subunit [Acidobacteriota bacterium]